jgi:predicted secreted protein
MQILPREGMDMVASALRSAVLASLLLGLATFVGTARADADDAKNRVSFGVQRSREVENDWVTAVIGATHEDEDPAEVADRINRDMSWALGLAKSKQQLRLRSGGYRTTPMQDPKRAQIRRWRGSQDLIVEGGDVAVVSELLGQLQARLQLRSIVFSVSPERRRSIEDELIDAALDAFGDRAERVRRKLGAKGYALVQLQVDATGGPPIVPLRGRTLAVAEAAVAPPALEGGTSTLSAGAHGTIELEF